MVSWYTGKEESHNSVDVHPELEPPRKILKVDVDQTDQSVCNKPCTYSTFEELRQRQDILYVCLERAKLEYDSLVLKSCQLPPGSVAAEICRKISEIATHSSEIESNNERMRKLSQDALQVDRIQAVVVPAETTTGFK